MEQDIFSEWLFGNTSYNTYLFGQVLGFRGLVKSGSVTYIL